VELALHHRQKSSIIQSKVIKKKYKMVRTSGSSQEVVSAVRVLNTKRNKQETNSLFGRHVQFQTIAQLTVALLKARK
jgi:hypothetical protein